MENKTEVSFSLYTLAKSTRRIPFSVSIARNLSSPVFVVWQQYGRRYNRDTRRHRDTELHRPARQGEGRRRHGATAYGGHIAATLLRGPARVRRRHHRPRSLRFQAGSATGDGRGR